ncbi:hypothetical protein EE612_057334, partial [Oryza sativa]
TGPALEDLLPQLSHEEQLRLHNHLREHEAYPQVAQQEFSSNIFSALRRGRDFFIIIHVRSRSPPLQCQTPR